MPLNCHIRWIQTPLRLRLQQRCYTIFGQPVTHSLDLTHYKRKNIQVFQVLDEKGVIKSKEHENSVSADVLLEILKIMIALRAHEGIMLDAQRQGRICFTMKSTGEEATTVASCAALHPDDWIYSQYREAGAHLWRGYTLENMIHQSIGNIHDDTKGRQMPMHYGVPRTKMFMVSSPLATQMTQAVGSAYATRLQNKPGIVACYLGDGAASEGDAHVSYNMAATMGCPTLFLCRNNQYAISTPVSHQYHVDGPADSALGCGISCLRVDGSDALAVYASVALARKYCAEKSAPAFIEFISYRQCDHSTSDDSSAYRTSEELKESAKKCNPIERLSTYLATKGLWSAEKEKKHIEETSSFVLAALKRAEGAKLHPIASVLEDIYEEMSPRLRKQQQYLLSHVNKYPSEYSLVKYAE